MIGRRDPHGITAEKPDEGDEAELAEWLAAIVRSAPSLIRVLLTARALELPDWLIMSGAVYQRVLNALTKQVPIMGQGITTSAISTPRTSPAKPRTR